jgi:hypothetical protein|uniref:Phage protein n=1 Tax=Siphoviridae sp. ctNlb4 TaxID=2826305 RepID=A0A8S5QUY2_9CAUD|nr:MAG TPA: hypothetical protein [Siphoviridae sp. ctNlb4]DAZ07238.1 MAG TPA: hypothetical protein [Caudoviricetes sp.]
MFLDIGGKPLDFWDLTILEIRDMIESHNRVTIQKQKEKIVESYRLSQMIANNVSLLLSKEAKPLDVWDYAPDLFQEERDQVEKARQEQEMRMHKERMRAFAESHNRKMKMKGE